MEEESEKKQKYPSFIDKQFIKTLSKEKKKYWARRIKGESGQERLEIEAKVFKESGVNTTIDNNGNLTAYNRKARRNRPLKLNIFTKATNSIKKERQKHAKQQRIRAAAKARKARRARYSEVS